jgi:hypothetical protein
VRLLLERVIAIWVVFASFSAGVVLIARANHEPDRLQALGFDVCDGEPCFRGITLGMAWKEVRRRLPDTFEIGDPPYQYVEVPIGMTDIKSVRIFSSEDGKTAKLIFVDANVPGYAIYAYLPISAGEIVARYGTPCRTLLLSAAGGRDQMHMIYPKLKIVTSIVDRRLVITGQPSPFRLQVDSYVLSFTVSSEKGYATCEQPVGEKNGPLLGYWRGFTSPEIYEARNRRTFAVMR